jgi:hypothetical protein
VVAVDLTDDGDQVDGHGPIAGSGAGCPRPAQDGLGHAVELADVAEGEAAQEGPQRGRGHHPVAEHGRGEPGAEHVGVVDAVTADHQRVQQGEHLAARPVGTRTVAKVDQLIDGSLDPQSLSQRGGQQQPGAGDPMAVVESAVELVQGVDGCHRESALLLWAWPLSQAPFSHFRGPFSYSAPVLFQYRNRGRRRRATSTRS